VFRRLRADHQHVLAGLPALERAAGIAAARRGPRTGGAAPRRSSPAARAKSLSRIFQALARQFNTHMSAEDEVLFPTLGRALPETLGRLEPLQLEHQELRKMLDSLTDLVRMPASRERDEQVAVQTRDFVDLLRIHVRKEDVVVFRVAERVLGPDQLDEVADRLNRGEAERVRRTRGKSKGRRS
jgi:hemerythrin-like domain-containing protein